MKLEESLPVHFNNRPLVPVLSQLNPVHIPHIDLFKIFFFLLALQPHWELYFTAL